MTIQYANINSSAIRSAMYDGEDLTVVFRNGNAYQYFEVSPIVFNNLQFTESAGQFYNDNIRGCYNSIRVDLVNILDIVRDVDFHSFQSSFLTHAEYDRESEIATITIRDRVYQYRIHPDCWAAFISAESAGAFFNNFISGVAERV